MATLTLQQVKDYLRIQHTAEDVLIEMLIGAAKSAISGWLHRPIAIEERTFVMETKTYHGTGYSVASCIQLPVFPLESLQSITDADDEDILGDVYFTSRAGTIRYYDNSEFENGPYTIKGTVGLAGYDEYESSIEPVINMAILDVVSDLWHRRNPAASAEREGGGIAVEYSNQVRGVAAAGGGREDLISPRTAALLAPWRLISV
jgi:hypothetical protein